MAQPWADARCRWTLREFPAVYWHQSCLTENLRSASAGDGRYQKSHHQGSGPGCVKTKSDLGVTPSGR